jgi:hypothetical protein
MSGVTPMDDDAALDERIIALLSSCPGAKSDDIASLIREAETAAVAARDDRRKELQAAIKILGKQLPKAKCGEAQEAKFLKDRRHKVAGIKKIFGHRWPCAPIKDDHGVTTPEVIVEAELGRLECRRAALKSLHSRGSKKQKRALRQLSAALRKAKLGLPEDLCRLFSLDRMIAGLEDWQKSPPAPKTAYAERMATLSARRLCETFGIALTTTRKRTKKTDESGSVSFIVEASIFCRLAAYLHGDESVNMQPYCREEAKHAQEEAKHGSKTAGQK